MLNGNILPRNWIRLSQKQTLKVRQGVKRKINRLTQLLVSQDRCSCYGRAFVYFILILVHFVLNNSVYIILFVRLYQCALFISTSYCLIVVAFRDLKHSDSACNMPLPGILSPCRRGWKHKLKIKISFIYILQILINWLQLMWS